MVISSLKLKPELYHSMMHFFRSTGYEVSHLYAKWIQVAEREIGFLEVSGRTVLLGDHIKIPKEGRRMPGVQIIRQESQNSGKGDFIEGHIHAQVSAVVSRDGVSRSLPLITQRQQSPPRKEGSKKPDGETLVTQMLNLSAKVVESIGNAVMVIALDAYFAKATAFLAADKCVDETGSRFLEIVTRGRDDTVGYTLPKPQPKGKRGPKPKYGDKISLWALFSDMDCFSEAILMLYGKPTNVKYLCLDLKWKPLDGRLIRFTLVDSPLGKMILMCSDLTLAPEDAITIYSLRFKIETSFDEQKNVNGGFAYRFWTTALEKRKRWAKNNQPPQTGSFTKVDEANRAIETYLCLSTIATGILMIIGFMHNRQIWNRFPGWLRTQRNSFPTISVIKETLAQDFPAFMRMYPDLHLCSVVSTRQREMVYLYADDVA
jgi:hypothetical protein